MSLLQAVAVCSLVLALICALHGLAIAVLASRQGRRVERLLTESVATWERRSADEDVTTPDWSSSPLASPQTIDRIAPLRERTGRGSLVVALAALVLAGVVAAVEAKVADAKGGDGTLRGTKAHGLLDDGRNFRGTITLSGAPKSERCLVRYLSAKNAENFGEREHRWWSPCREVESLRTIADARERFALPPDWGPYNRRLRASLPEDARVTYLAGPASPQWSQLRQHVYRGGATQYRFLRFDNRWIQRRECPSSDDENRPVTWKQC
jgi:hypothetical protein